MASGPRLNWGLLAARGARQLMRAPVDLARVWQVAEDSLGLTVQPIERFELAGTLNQHPGHVRSDEAKRSFPAIFALAVASRTAPEPLRSASRDGAVAALLSWAGAYRPSGNPIDEWFFVPLLQAVDLTAGQADPEDGNELLRWARDFAVAGDEFYRPRAERNAGRANNWMARRLLIRTVASTVAGDDRARMELPAMLQAFVARNYVGDESGHPDGRTFDFVQRDALHYHMAAVHPLVEVLLYAPDLVSGNVRAAITAGLGFLRPFFLGERVHIEFARTTVSFDLERRDAGNPVFQQAPWDPARGRVLLRVARAVFPEVRGWTEGIVDAAYDPRTKLLAAIYGEPQRVAAWA
jgi:hypothetical protein